MYSSEFLLLIVCRFRKIAYFCTLDCPDGGIGRRAGLKHQWIHFHAGSTPALGTKKLLDYQGVFFLEILLS